MTFSSSSKLYRLEISQELEWRLWRAKITHSSPTSEQTVWSQNKSQYLALRSHRLQGPFQCTKPGEKSGSLFWKWSQVNTVRIWWLPFTWWSLFTLRRVSKGNEYSLLSSTRVQVNHKHKQWRWPQMPQPPTDLSPWSHTDSSPARQGISRPTKHIASQSPSLPCVVLATQKSRYKTLRWPSRGPHTPNFPQKKIQVNQLQKQPTVPSHLLQRASPRSQLGISAHVRSWRRPSFVGESFACVCLTTTSRIELYRQSCTPPHQM